MNTLKNIAVTMTLAAVALSGAALAREPGDRGERNRDRVEQSDIDREARRAERRAERRASDDDVVVREGRRAHRAERREQRSHRVDDDRYARYGRVDRRQDKQRSRIIQGRRSGELTRGEAHRLKKQQKKINRMERRFSRDGYLSARERYRLERAQDRASRRIARLKHNDVYRGSGHRYAYGRSSYKRRW